MWRSEAGGRWPAALCAGGRLAACQQRPGVPIHQAVQARRACTGRRAATRAAAQQHAQRGSGAAWPNGRGPARAPAARARQQPARRAAAGPGRMWSRGAAPPGRSARAARPPRPRPPPPRVAAPATGAAPPARPARRSGQDRVGSARAAPLAPRRPADPAAARRGRTARRQRATAAGAASAHSADGRLRPGLHRARALMLRGSRPDRRQLAGRTRLTKTTKSTSTSAHTSGASCVSATRRSRPVRASRLRRRRRQSASAPNDACGPACLPRSAWRVLYVLGPAARFWTGEREAPSQRFAGLRRAIGARLPMHAPCGGRGCGRAARTPACARACAPPHPSTWPGSDAPSRPPAVPAWSRSGRSRPVAAPRPPAPRARSGLHKCRSARRQCCTRPGPSMPPEAASGLRAHDGAPPACACAVPVAPMARRRHAEAPRCT